MGILIWNCSNILLKFNLIFGICIVILVWMLLEYLDFYFEMFVISLELSSDIILILQWNWSGEDQHIYFGGDIPITMIMTWNWKLFQHCNFLYCLVMILIILIDSCEVGSQLTNNTTRLWIVARMVALKAFLIERHVFNKTKPFYHLN